jgi:hypothetical protein
MWALKRSLLKGGVDSNKCTQGTGFSHFYMQSPCNPLIRRLNRDILCKMNLRRPRPMRNIHGLSLIFITFDVPALTPVLNNSENSLQLSEDVILLSVCRIYNDVLRKETYKDTRCLRQIIYIHCTMWGQDGTLWHLCLYSYIPWCRHFTFDGNSELSMIKKISNKLD